MSKEGALVLIALRLRIQNEQISEIETFVVRSERAAQNVEKLGRPHHLFLEAIPPAERMSRADLVRIAKRPLRRRPLSTIGCSRSGRAVRPARLRGSGHLRA